jgi:F-type H+-transporting ATPase subunit gamma
MTHRRELEKHRSRLAEIRNIMNSMKTLAYLETRKLSRFLGAQQAVLQNIETVAADLLDFYPEILPTQTPEQATVYILIGSERGFCGDFNHTLRKHFDELLHVDTAPAETVAIATGHKLHILFEEDARITTCIEGVSAAEEIMSLLQQLVAEVIAQQARYGLSSVYCLYHGSEEGVRTQKIMPPFLGSSAERPGYHHPPLFQLPVPDLFASLIDHYLFALLYEILCTSFMIENRHRIAHLEGAVKRLDDESSLLIRKCNALRQEELIEEIEVILLGASLSQG